MSFEWLDLGLEELSTSQEELVSLITMLTQIPAPSHDELQRSEAVSRLMGEFGFPSVQIDEVGNVLGFFPGLDPGKTIVSMAHIDTVFPKETDLTVKREGNVLWGPGISDNTASVCQMLLIGRLFAKHLPLPHPVILIGNVAEEGLGDLKGARFFWDNAENYDFDGAKIARESLVFLNIDGGMGQLINGGIGSRRLRIRFSGEGGHSWGSFGNSSAVHGLGTAIAKIAKIEVPLSPRTTYNVGVIGGGHSVNSIAEDAWMLLDMRSVVADALGDLERTVLGALGEASRETGTTYLVDVMGDRPTGSIPDDSPLVRALVALGERHGIKLFTSTSSTDSNIPLSHGWPAVTMGFKHSKDAHKTSEFLYIDSLVPGIQFLLRCYDELLHNGDVRSAGGVD